MNKLEYEKMYLENEKLAYKLGHKLGIINNEDMMQNIKLALYKAIITYDITKGLAFSTYAYTVMLNEYNYSFRDKNRKFQYVDNQIFDKDEDLVSIFEVIPNEDISLDEQLENSEFYEIINNYLDSLEPLDRSIYKDYYFEHIQQNKLAKVYELSQSQVSRKLKAINKELQKLLKDYK